MSTQTTIYHNPKCGTSRNVLALIRNAGIEPQIIHYLQTPPSTTELKSVLSQMAIPVRDLIRTKEPRYLELGLDNPELSDDQLITLMVQNPVLINRPVVVTERGAKLCRPSEQVLDILPLPQQGAFSKEDGEAVVDAQGQRIT